MKLYTDTHGPQMMMPTYFSDPLTFLTSYQMDCHEM